MGSMILAEGTASYYTITTLLKSASEVITWLITSMGDYLKFMTDNTAILVWFFASLSLLALKVIRRFF